MSNANIYMLAWSLMGYGLYATGRPAHGAGAYVVGFAMFFLEKFWV